jgi:hypothetical protein
MKRPDLIRKHTRILEEKGLLMPLGRAADLRPARPPGRCVVCGKELPPRLAWVCSGECYEKKPT